MILKKEYQKSPESPFLHSSLREVFPFWLHTREIPALLLLLLGIDNV